MKHPSSSPKRIALVLLLVLAVAAAATALRPRPARASRLKVLVLGFDGADFTFMKKLLDAGKLPHIAELQKSGTVSPLLPTNPAQTPVSWTAWATGKNPGKTEIFDFLKRNQGTYYPTFAMNEDKKKEFSVPLPGLGETSRTGLAGVATVLTGVVVLLLLSLLRVKWAVRGALTILLGGLSFLLWKPAALKYLPEKVPYAVNNAKGATFWELASKKGVKARVVHVPATFPARPFAEGQILSGLGVPDLRGRVGTPAYYTDDPSINTGDNEFSLEMFQLDGSVDAWDKDRDGKQLTIYGPPNQLFYDKAKDPQGTGVDSDGNPKQIKVPFSIKRDVNAKTVTLEASWSPDGPVTLKEGEWSDWRTIAFPFNCAVKAKGFAKFRLFSVKPLKLYCSPINIHPDNPIFWHNSPITQPEGYISQLYRKFGLFKTIGWQVDTWTLSSDLGDEEFFKEDVESTVKKEMELLDGLGGTDDIDLYVQVFEFTDRVGHIIWRLIDPQHPRYDPDKAAKYAILLEQAYQKMDDIVGQGMKLAEANPGTVLLVSSDHGFTSFRRSMNYNTWLIQNGFMVVRDTTGRVMTVEDLFSHNVDSFFVGVDWSQTKAYALGLGALYINLQGREPQGSVPPSDYDLVRDQIVTGLEAYVDEATGLKPIAKVYKREEMYTGFDPGLIPDMRVANTANYRVSWQTSLGGFPAAMVQDNDKNWSGDHCSVDPVLVKGILLSNKKLTPPRPDGPQVIDLSPTILKALDAPIPDDMDGKPLL